MKVAIVGASAKNERYSNKTLKTLVAHGYDVVPVNPALEEIEGIKTSRSVSEIPSGSVDTVTMYIGRHLSTGMLEDIAHLAPRRVIFNPGAENRELENALSARGIEVIEDCTLIMLGTCRF